MTYRLAKGNALVAALVVVGSLVGAAPGARAGEAPPRIDGVDALVAAIGAAWEAGPGRASGARIRGEERARGRVPGDLLGVEVGARWDQPLRGADAVFEAALEAGLVVRLGSLSAATRSAYAAAAATTTARRAADRWAFARDAVRRYVQWWKVAASAAHVEDHLRELAALLVPIRAAVEQRLLVKIVALDLEVEVARVEVELEHTRHEVVVAQRALDTLLGPISFPTPDVAAFEEPGVFSAPDPWPTVASRLGAHPALALARAREAEERALAAAAEAADPATLLVGVGARQEGEGKTFGGVALRLTVPFGNASAPAAERHRAEAEAGAVERAWSEQLLAGELAEMSARYDTAASHLELVDTRLIGALRRRTELLAAALLEGRARLDEVVRAERDLLEAHHERVLAAADLLSQHAEAKALLDLLAPPPAPGASE